MPDWISYWNNKDAMSGEFWQAQADFTLNRISRELSFGPDDVVLDIGCGKAQMIAALAGRVREAHGADTSALCMEEASRRYAAQSNLHFHTLPSDNYLGIDTLSLPPVTRIVCISVVQYYKSLDELRTLIANAKKIAAPGCRMLIADLLIDYNFVKDVAGVLLGGILSGTFRHKLSEALSGKHGQYSRTRADNPVLTLRRGDMEAICAAEGVSLRFIPKNLTGNCFRYHALIDIENPATRNPS